MNPLIIIGLIALYLFSQKKTVVPSPGGAGSGALGTNQKTQPQQKPPAKSSGGAGFGGAPGGASFGGGSKNAAASAVSDPWAAWDSAPGTFIQGDSGRADDVFGSIQDWFNYNDPGGELQMQADETAADLSQEFASNYDFQWGEGSEGAALNDALGSLGSPDVVFAGELDGTSDVGILSDMFDSGYGDWYTDGGYGDYDEWY